MLAEFIQTTARVEDREHRLRGQGCRWKERTASRHRGPSLSLLLRVTWFHESWPDAEEGPRRVTKANLTSTREPPHRARARGTTADVEKATRAAIPRRARPGSPSGKVKLTLTLYLNQEQAERLAARAICEGKNLEAIVAEILESASK
jgi:hypothetical protein